MKPAELVTPSDVICNPHVLISDFGEAWLQRAESRHELSTPVLLLPPEASFSKNSIGSSADVWTLGCSLYEILGERPLFEGFMPDKDDVIAEMVSCLGILPEYWWKSWLARADFFHWDGAWRTDMERCHDPKSRPLLLRIQQMGREDDAIFSPDESVALEKMLRSMLEYNPSKRATIEDVINSDWFTRFGRPALHV